MVYGAIIHNHHFHWTGCRIGNRWSPSVLPLTVLTSKRPAVNVHAIAETCSCGFIVAFHVCYSHDCGVGFFCQHLSHQWTLACLDCTLTHQKWTVLSLKNSSLWVDVITSFCLVRPLWCTNLIGILLHPVKILAHPVAHLSIYLASQIHY